MNGNDRYPQGKDVRRVVSNSSAEADTIISELDEILSEPDLWFGEGVQFAEKNYHPFEIFT